MEYAIHTDVKFGPLTLIDAGALADACTEPWWNQTLCRVNDSAVRLGVFNGEHRTRAKERTVVLMVEVATVVPTGDFGSLTTEEN